MKPKITCSDATSLTFVVTNAAAVSPALGPNRLKRAGAGTHGGTKRMKRRRDRFESRYELRCRPTSD